MQLKTIHILRMLIFFKEFCFTLIKYAYHMTRSIIYDYVDMFSLFERYWILQEERAHLFTFGQAKSLWLGWNYCTLLANFGQQNYDNLLKF